MALYSDFVIGDPPASLAEFETYWGKDLPRLVFNRIDPLMLDELWAALSAEPSVDSLDKLAQFSTIGSMLVPLPPDFIDCLARTSDDHVEKIAAEWSRGEHIQFEAPGANLAPLLSEIVAFARRAKAESKTMFLDLHW